mgnify:FL=1
MFYFLNKDSVYSFFWQVWPRQANVQSTFCTCLRRKVSSKVNVEFFNFNDYRNCWIDHLGSTSLVVSVNKQKNASGQRNHNRKESENDFHRNESSMPYNFNSTIVLKMNYCCPSAI